MDQDQALALLRNVVDNAKLTRQERENAYLAIQLLKQLGKEFTEMVLAKRAEDAAMIKTKSTPELKKNPDAPKVVVDTSDKSIA